MCIYDSKALLSAFSEDLLVFHFFTMVLCGGWTVCGKTNQDEIYDGVLGRNVISIVPHVLTASMMFLQSALL